VAREDNFPDFRSFWSPDMPTASDAANAPERFSLPGEDEPTDEPIGKFAA
jgi:hypothetical protein